MYHSYLVEHLRTDKDFNGDDAQVYAVTLGGSGVDDITDYLTELLQEGLK